jgi:hypothetical protein
MILALRLSALLPFVPIAAAAVAWLNRDFYRFLAKRRGTGFAVRMFPIHLLFFFYSGAGYLYARFGLRQLRGSSQPFSQAQPASRGLVPAPTPLFPIGSGPEKRA